MMARSNRIRRIGPLTRASRRRPERLAPARSSDRAAAVRRLEPARVPRATPARPARTRRPGRRIRLVVSNRAPRRIRHVPPPKLVLVAPRAQRRRALGVDARPGDPVRHTLGTLIAAVALAAAGLAAIAASVGRFFAEAM